MIAIIDYDAGNIRSVEKALAHLGEKTVLTRDGEEILSAEKIILPRFGLVEVIHEAVRRQIPFLGICLGLQLLFEKSEESPGVDGLGVLRGEILKIPHGEGLKIPHMGWNSLRLQNHGHLFRDIPGDAYVYFVHSYYLRAAEPSIVKAVASYGVPIHASVEQGSVFACQFHPEKSSRTGLQILKNFASIGRRAE